MSKRTRKRAPEYLVETEEVQNRYVSLEIKEIKEGKVNESGKVLLQFKFKDKGSLNMFVPYNSADYWYWKNFKRGEAVTAIVRGSKIKELR